MDVLQLRFEDRVDVGAGATMRFSFNASRTVTQTQCDFTFSFGPIFFFSFFVWPLIVAHGTRMQIFTTNSYRQ